MKRLKIFLFCLTLSASFAISSCGDSSSNTEQQGKEYTSAYICPMHCEGSGSEEPGKCPVCGMDYEMNENYEAGAQDHDGHEGHNH